MIYEVKSYSDDEGRRVTEKIPIKNDYNIFPPSYTGIIVMQTQMGNIPIPFEFANGYSIESCFEDFDYLAQKKIEEIKNASKIIPATGMPTLKH